MSEEGIEELQEDLQRAMLPGPGAEGGESHLVVDDGDPGVGVTDVAARSRLLSVLVSQTEVETLDHGGESERGESSWQDLPHVAPGADLMVTGEGRVQLVCELPVGPPEGGGDWPGLQDPHLAPLGEAELDVERQVHLSEE